MGDGGDNVGSGVGDKASSPKEKHSKTVSLMVLSMHKTRLCEFIIYPRECRCILQTRMVHFG